MKKAILFMGALLLSANLMAGVIEEGEAVPNMTWTDSNGEEARLEDAKGQIRVLIHFAGY